MNDDQFDDLNNTGIEAPGGTQATHSAAEGARGPRVSPRERVVRKLTGARDAGVNYVRENNPADMKQDLETQIRAHPIASLAVALLGGYLLAKITD